MYLSQTDKARHLRTLLPKEDFLDLYTTLDEDGTSSPFLTAMEAEAKDMAPEMFSAELEEDSTVDEDPWDEEDEALAQASFITDATDPSGFEDGLD